MDNEPWRPHLADAQRGDLTAQEHLIQCTRRRIAGFVFSFVGDAAVIDDLAQQIFIRMLRGLCRLKDPDRFEVWLFRLARNVCLNHLRAEKWRRRFVPFSPGDEPEAPVPPEEDEERAAWLEKAVLSLPASQRELLVLLRDGAFRYDDLARITGTTVSSVKSRLFRARERLRRLRQDDRGGQDGLSG